MLSEEGSTAMTDRTVLSFGASRRFSKQETDDIMTSRLVCPRTVSLFGRV